MQVEDFFPDCKQFVNDVRYLMKEGAFQDVEVYRLRKIVNKLKKLPRMMKLSTSKIMPKIGPLAAFLIFLFLSLI